MKKIAFVTGSRADYGIVRRYLDLLNKDDDIDLKILVTGALLSETYGNQVTCPVMLSSSIQATLIGRYGQSDYGKRTV